MIPAGDLPNKEEEAKIRFTSSCIRTFSSRVVWHGNASTTECTEGKAINRTLQAVAWGVWGEEREKKGGTGERGRDTGRGEEREEEVEKCGRVRKGGGDGRGGRKGKIGRSMTEIEV